jgi:hypothetical protein
MTPSFGLLRLHRKCPRDDGGAFRQEGAHCGAAAGAIGAPGAAVAAMDQAVAIAGLTAAFFLKDNPRLDFRTHSNLRNLEDIPPHAIPFKGECRKERRCRTRGYAKWGFAREDAEYKREIRFRKWWIGRLGYITSVFPDTNSLLTVSN